MATGDGFVDHHPGRVNVGAHVRPHARELLRGHVGGRSDGHSRIGSLLVRGPPGDAEVGQDAPPVFDEQVGGLYVPMDDTVRVCHFERVQEVAPELPRGIDGQRPVLLEMTLEGFPVQVVHHIVIEACLFVDVVNRDDVGMSHSGEDARFVHELSGRLGGPQLWPQHLRRPQAVERHRAHEVHTAHAAARQLAQQLVVRRQGRTQALKEGRHSTENIPALSRKVKRPRDAPGPFRFATIEPATVP